MSSIGVKKLAEIFSNILSGYGSNIEEALQRRATEQTAAYIESNMAKVQSVSSVFAVHDEAIKQVVLEGLVLEFGVFSGKTINYISASRLWHVHGFDSFEGLPEHWRDGFPRGHFKMDQLPKVNDNVTLHKGWFDESIDTFLSGRRNEEKIAYLHVDCDLYSSTKTIFDKLGHLISVGTIIVFDEYFNYSGWKEAEYKAFQEYVREKGVNYEYISYNRRHQQVAVKVTKI